MRYQSKLIQAVRSHQAMLALIFLSGAASAPSVQTIIQRSSQANEADWKASPLYVCNEKDPTKDGSKTYEDLMIEGTPYQRLIAVNDQPLSQEEQQKEQEKLQKTIAERKAESAEERRNRIAKYEKERQRDHSMMQELVKAFNFQLIGREKISGRDTYVVQATPRPGYHPATMQTKPLTAMEGKLWIDTQTFQWVRVEAQTVRPVSIEGFLARVEPGTRFELEKAPVDKGVWLATHFSMKARAEVLGLIPKNESEEEFYSDCHRQASTTATQPTAAER